MSTSRSTALITGATAGIGAAFARQLAAQGYDLVLVARRTDRLEAAAAELSRHGAAVATLAADLATDEGAAIVGERLADPTAPVGMLVNNAGIGLNSSFLGSKLADEEQLLRLNVLAVMRLTHAVLPGMVERGRGDIVNISSVAGFGPVMPGSTYSSSKAWVTNFSESIGQLVRGYGVRVMALCPGYTRTEFHQRAGIDMTRMPAWLWLDADRLVRDGLADLRRGRSVSVPGWQYKAAVLALRHLPHSLVSRVSRDTRGRVRND